MIHKLRLPCPDVPLEMLVTAWDAGMILYVEQDEAGVWCAVIGEVEEV